MGAMVPLVISDGGDACKLEVFSAITSQPERHFVNFNLSCRRLELPAWGRCTHPEAVADVPRRDSAALGVDTENPEIFSIFLSCLSWCAPRM
jgi:hypothetical protein